MQRLSIKVPKPTPASAAMQKAMEKPLPPEKQLGTIGALHLSGLEGGTLAIVIKKTYDLFPNALPRVAEEQIPLDAEGQLHDPIADVVEPSWKSLPELIGHKTGTDVILQGFARPPRPTHEWKVGIKWGNYTHEAWVFGHRQVDVMHNRVVFTPPQPFEALPLRHELAYGGADLVYEEKYISELKKNIPDDKYRKVAPAIEHLWGDNNYLLRYPRNRFGMAYAVAPHPNWHIGRALPHLERPDDRLTPERLITSNPAHWQKQPIPVGFDYLDPYTFPINAMMGIAPPGFDPNGPQPEVKRNILPADFYRGNVALATDADIANILHPMLGRQASLGLWFGPLRGSETVELLGVDPAHPVFRVVLPNEYPVVLPLKGLTLPEVKSIQLTKIHLDSENRKLIQTWSVRYPMPVAPHPDFLKSLPESIQVHFKRIS